MSDATNSARGIVHLARREHILLGLVFVLALVIRGLYVLGQARDNPLFDVPMMDALVHHQWALRIASGEGLDAVPYFRAPLYYYLLGWFYWLVGPSIVAAQAAGAVLGAVTCYLIARLAAALSGFRAGVVAGLIASLYWPAIFLEAQLLTVGLEVFLDVILLLLLVYGAAGRNRAVLLAAGVIWGLSAITRPNVLAFAPGIALGLWYVQVDRSRWRRAGGDLAVTCVACLLTVLPVTIRNRVVGGEWTLISTNGGVNFFIGNNPRSDGISAKVPGARQGLEESMEDIRRIAEVGAGRHLSAGEVSKYWYQQAFAWITNEPAGFLRLTLKKFRLFWSAYEIPNNQPNWPFARQAPISLIFWIGFTFVGSLGVAGLVIVFRDNRSHVFLAVFGLLYMATVVAFFCNARYRLPITPVLIVFAGAGMVRFVELIGRRHWRMSALYAAVAIAMAVFIMTNPPPPVMRRLIEAKWHRNLNTYYAQLPSGEGGSDELSLKHAAIAVRLAPGNPEYRLALVRAQLKLQQTDAALQQLEIAVRYRPEHPETRWVYGRVLASLGRYEDAVAQFQAAIRVQEAYAEAHADLGCVLLRLGRRTEAVQHLRIALQLQPDLQQAQACMNAVSADAGDSTH